MNADPTRRAAVDERDTFCERLGPHLADAMEALGIEDVDSSEGRALADTVYCLGYRQPEPGSAVNGPPSGRVAQVATEIAAVLCGEGSCTYEAGHICGELAEALAPSIVEREQQAWERGHFYCAAEQGDVRCSNPYDEPPEDDQPREDCGTCPSCGKGRPVSRVDGVLYCADCDRWIEDDE